ncbi:hypothetical protein [Paenibacillus terrae]|uniref:Uncharacterized protein n=1 Tax=Paenibacillus terrae TaxID=159743 RepID=A0A0D7WZF6_9BACL|nr:hypothetical protein [Paenibacillus terrae]KJD44545.1 hypothetical protein QD47_16280 [Paenibacillus terrae]
MRIVLPIAVATGFFHFITQDKVKIPLQRRTLRFFRTIPPAPLLTIHKVTSILKFWVCIFGKAQNTKRK